MVRDVTPLELKIAKLLSRRLGDDAIAETLDVPVQVVAAVAVRPEGKRGRKKRQPTAEQQQEKVKHALKKARQELLRQQEEQRRARRRELEQPKFKTKEVDYSQMHAVRIDHKTIIYAKPGEDPETVKQNYLNKRKSTK